MEDVLEVYHREYQENEVLVCLDETSEQQSLPSATTGGEGDPAAPSTTPRICQSIRFRVPAHGVSNLFMLFAPLEGWRRVEVTQRRTKSDWAQVVRKLVDEDYAHKDRIVLVMDNPVSWYGAGSEHSPSIIVV